MAIFSEGVKYSGKMFWYNALQALYSFPPVIRVLLFIFVIGSVPGYFAVKSTTAWWYGRSYAQQDIGAHASFANPQPLSMQTGKVVEFETGGYIAYSQITNPNLDLAVPNVKFNVVLKNSRGEQIYVTTASTFILPGESKYVVTPRLNTSEQARTAVFEVADIRFQKRISIPQVKISTSSPVKFLDSDAVRFEGAIVNNSPYTLKRVILTFFVKNSTGQIVGITQRSEDTVRAGSRRAYVLRWPKVFEGELSLDVKAETNPLDSGNLQVSP